MTSCKKAAELISLSWDGPLGWRQRLALTFHLTLCDMCRRFRRHSWLVQTAGRDAADRAAADATLPEAARERIREALRTDQNRGRLA
jgi:hypothetical protein